MIARTQRAALARTLERVTAENSEDALEAAQEARMILARIGASWSGLILEEVEQAFDEGYREAAQDVARALGRSGTVSLLIPESLTGGGA